MGLLDQPQFPLDHPDGKALWESLAKLYQDNAKVKILCRLAGLAVQEMEFSGRAPEVWLGVLDYAAKTEKLPALLQVIAEDPESPSIRHPLQLLLAESAGDGEKRSATLSRPGPQEERHPAATARADLRADLRGTRPGLHRHERRAAAGRRIRGRSPRRPQAA